MQLQTSLTSIGAQSEGGWAVLTEQQDITYFRKPKLDKELETSQEIENICTWQAEYKYKLQSLLIQWKVKFEESTKIDEDQKINKHSYPNFILSQLVLKGTDGRT